MTYLEVAPDGRIIAASESEITALNGGEVVQVDGAVDPLSSLYIDGEVLDVGPRPSFRHVMSPAARSWVVPGTTPLQLAQQAKWDAVKAERDRLETAGFPYLGKWIDSDARSVQRITGAVQSAQAALAAGAPFEIGWTCADNSVIELDGQQMLGMTVALAEHANGLHVTARGLRALIYAVDATESSVAAVAWPEEGGSQ